MKTIYNTFVVMQDQSQCDRMKQLCIDNGLPIWDYRDAFKFTAEFFGYNNADGFAVYGTYFPEETQITEQEFIELLKTTK